MPYTNLPTWPLLLFGVIEPLLLVWAYVVALRDPLDYFAGQSPNYPTSIAAIGPPAVSMTLQLANVFLLLGALAVVCCWTKHAEISFWYLIVVAFADFGHIYAAYRGVGSKYFWNPAGWSDMIAGSVGVSAFLNINRWLTVIGAFGKMQTVVEGKRKRT